MAQLSTKDRESAFRLYLILGALFIASLVSCNLIFRKFFTWTVFSEDFYTFEQSVGILPYPITFLLTDLISELFGAKRANQIVVAGLLSSLFVLLIIWVAGAAPAASWSPVSDGQFDHVFGQTALAVGASMCAYLIAQFVDIRVFHYLKKLTKGRHLWIRNNFSTITSQLIDTFTVIALLCLLGEIEWALFWTLLLNGFLFKMLVAAFDTPFFYLTTWLARRRFKLKVGEELELI